MRDRGLRNNPGERPSVMGPRGDRPDIWASEVGDFAYCARGWWLTRVAGHPAQGDQLGAGTISHGNVGVMITSIVSLERLVRILVGAVGCLAVAVVILLLVCGH